MTVARRLSRRASLLRFCIRPVSLSAAELFLHPRTRAPSPSSSFGRWLLRASLRLAMLVYVQLFGSSVQRTVGLDLRGDCTVADLHQRILQLHPDIVIKRCIFAGRQLEDKNKTIGQQRNSRQKQLGRRRRAGRPARRAASAPPSTHITLFHFAFFFLPPFLPPSCRQHNTMCTRSRPCKCSPDRW